MRSGTFRQDSKEDRHTCSSSQLVHSRYLSAAAAVKQASFRLTLRSAQKYPANTDELAACVLHICRPATVRPSIMLAWIGSDCCDSTGLYLSLRYNDVPSTYTVHRRRHHHHHKIL